MDMAKPIIRFKGYQDDWEQRKLSEIALQTYGGGTPKTANEEFWKGNIPWIQSSDLLEERLFNVKPRKYISQEAISKSSTKLVPQNSVAIVTRVGVGKLAFMPFSYATSQDFLSLSELKIEPEFAVYALYKMMRLVSNEVQGTSIKGITKDELLAKEILIPDCEEQKKIGAYLHNLDDLITLHQRKCDETKKLKKYMLQKMFPQNGEKVPEIRFSGFTDDWEQRKLGDLVIDHNAGIYISKEDYGEGTNVIGVGNIYDRDIFDGEIYRLGPVNDDKFILDENDILYGESSLVPEGIARTVCVGKNGAGSAFAWHTRRVKLDKNIVNSHVATLELNYLHDIRKYLVSVSTQTALTGMTTEGYFGVTLTLPSVEEQQKISDYFKNLDTLITLHQRELENLQNIKKFMLEKMFV